VTVSRDVSRTESSQDSDNCLLQQWASIKFGV